MNLKIILKTLFILALLSLLVLMGMSNKGKVELDIPQLFSKPLKQPAALMYFGFFGIGFLAGTIIMAGGGGKKGGKGD